MTASEFSSEFDILYNNISSNQSPGLTEYEKSVFLTKAQDEIIKNHFTNKPNGNKYQEGIEDSAKRYSDFSCLITVKNISLGDTEDIDTIDERGEIYQLPEDLMLTLNEKLVVPVGPKKDVTYQVIPVSFQEYQRLMSRPSSDPLKKQVWKLMGNSKSGNGSIEIIRHYKDEHSKYLTIRYVRHPYPIILESLEPQGLFINGKQVPYGQRDYPEISNPDEIPEPTDECCELAKESHPEILQRAVELAKIYYTGAPADVITAGQRSE